MLNIATITVSKRNPPVPQTKWPTSSWGRCDLQYGITYTTKPKGRIDISVVQNGLRGAIREFFRAAKPFGVTDANTTFTFNWE